jgi:outer membrane cobalamin receptor
MVPLAVLASMTIAEAAPVSGVVRDVGGGVVPGATVVVRDGDGIERQVFTGPDGAFTVEVDAAGEMTIIVRAAGFAELTRRISVDERLRSIDLVLEPAGVIEALTVTASRGVIEASPMAATSVLSSDELMSSPGAMLDDQMKIVPGFSLFRRSSSRVANPTTQGLTMRGLSASGASRSLVLVDGVPLNDAFGGWIYWDRIPQTALERIEVVRGGTSDLYGADALGGILQIVTLAPTRTTAHMSAEFGSHETPRFSGAVGGSNGRWSGFGSGEWQQSDGYKIVAEEERGPVDVEANAEYGTGYGTVGYQSRSWRAGGRGFAFREIRGNGTPLTNNDTTSRGGTGEVSGTAGHSAWLVRGYGGTQDYNQSFSSVAAGRATETLTQTQFVPSRNGGVSGQWSSGMRRGTFTVGGDARRVSGTTEQTAYNPAGAVTAVTNEGGVQWISGGFARASFDPRGDLTVVGSIRVDRWSSDPNRETGTALDETEISPKGGIAWRVSETVTVHGAATHAFRAPTLNELFRVFRAGNSLTNANDQLIPESLTSAEGGVSVISGPASVRMVGFWNRLENAITNVTVSSTPALITRQRRNAGTVRAAGFEAEEEVRVAPQVVVTGSQAFVDSRFIDAVEPGLTDKRVSQVPKFSASTGVRYEAPWGILASGLYRYMGMQFDDDLNTLELASAHIVDLNFLKTVGRRARVFFTVENVGDTVYDVGRTPVRTTGLPRTFRAGIRADLP